MAQKWDYFTSFWNIVDIIPPVFILLTVTLNVLDSYAFKVGAEVQVPLEALSTLFMWLKFLYFLRIYENFGYLIRIVQEVVVDMRFFLCVLLLTVFAFADAFLSISMANPPDSRFTTDFTDASLYVYRMILGDFDTSDFGLVSTYMVWTLFVLCTVLNMIIMLNLLIAIISESFARINNQKELAGF